MGGVTRIARPDVRFRDSLLATIADFGELTAMHGSGYWHLGDGPLDTTERGVVAMVETLRGFGDTSRELGDAWSTATTSGSPTVSPRR